MKNSFKEGHKVYEYMMVLMSTLPLEQYGKGRAKTFTELIKEIESGECKIVWEDGIPIRCIQVVNIYVYSPAGKRLKEDRQEFLDGRVRRREMKGILEKRFPAEKINDAAIRAMQYVETKYDRITYFRWR